VGSSEEWICGLVDWWMCSKMANGKWKIENGIGGRAALKICPTGWWFGVEAT
jgi:hypothetical protein